MCLVVPPRNHQTSKPPDRGKLNVAQGKPKIEDSWQLLLLGTTHCLRRHWKGLRLRKPFTNPFRVGELLPRLSMTLKKWVHDHIILGNDQPFLRVETPGRACPSSMLLGRPAKFRTGARGKKKNNIRATGSGQALCFCLALGSPQKSDQTLKNGVVTPSAALVWFGLAWS